MNFVEPLCPLRVAADSPVRAWMEVPVSALVISPEKNAWNLALRSFIEQSMIDRESQTTKTQLRSQTRVMGKTIVHFFGRRHAVIMGEQEAKIQMLFLNAFRNSLNSVERAVTA